MLQKHWTSRSSAFVRWSPNVRNFNQAMSTLSVHYGALGGVLCERFPLGHHCLAPGNDMTKDHWFDDKVKVRYWYRGIVSWHPKTTKVI